MPEGWSFGLFSGIRVSGGSLWTDPYGAAWGYHESVHHPALGVDLAEGGQEALAIINAQVARAIAAQV